MTAIATLATECGRAVTPLGPVLIPDGATTFSLLFDILDEHIGWRVDTWGSSDFGLTWHYLGGGGRMSQCVSPRLGIIRAGLTRAFLPPGRNRLFRCVVTCLEPLAMSGVLAVGRERLPLRISGPEHHSVAFDAAPLAAGGNGLTTISTGTFTISGTERAGVLGLCLETETVSVTSGDIGGVGATAITGADSGIGTPFCRTLLWGETAPNTGAGQTGTMTWSAPSACELGCVTATGVNQGGVNTGTFTGGTFNPAAGGNPSVSVSSAVGDMTLGLGGVNAATLTATSQTERWNGQTGSAGASGTSGAGSASNSHTWTSGGAISVASGVNFQAAPRPYDYSQFPKYPLRYAGAS